MKTLAQIDKELLEKEIALTIKQEKIIKEKDELIKELTTALQHCKVSLDVYINGSNPNSPYKDGMHNCYVMGSREALQMANNALKKKDDKLV